jgi:phage-related protein
MKDTFWVKAALKEFQSFPAAAREIMQSALVVAAEGKKADIAKPLKGLGRA